MSQCRAGGCGGGRAGCPAALCSGQHWSLQPPRSLHAAGASPCHLPRQTWCFSIKKPHAPEDCSVLEHYKYICGDSAAFWPQTLSDAAWAFLLMVTLCLRFLCACCHEEILNKIRMRWHQHAGALGGWFAATCDFAALPNPPAALLSEHAWWEQWLGPSLSLLSLQAGFHCVCNILL